jgi:adenine-specific DNA methylase
MLGAYYTDQQVAEFLVSWAVRNSADTVMDPSFGGGVFLRAACKRVVSLGGSANRQVYGVEIDPSVYSKISEKLGDEYGIPSHHLYRVDFFGFDTRGKQVDAIVGNPPFIRYQHFCGDARRTALACAERECVRLSELCSSWAPFVVHAVSAIRPGGRLAVVVPAEIGHAAYARAVISYLRRSFRRVAIATFQKKLFPDLSEDTYLLMAEDKGHGPAEFVLRDFEHAGELRKLRFSRNPHLRAFKPVPDECLLAGEGRLTECFLSPKARGLYRELKQRSDTFPLGEIADVGIGYVTGANDFFHLGPDEAVRLSIPSDYLKPTVRRGKALSGLRLTHRDWSDQLDRRDTGYLLQIERQSGIPAPVRRYLDEGERLGVHRGYKCRTRDPWYRVPHVYMPDAFLTYMSGAAPRLVANDACAVAPNTLHVLRLHAATPISADGLSVLWQTGLTRLSSELEGHSMGGGMLKLEPTEAERVLIPWNSSSKPLDPLAVEVDQLLRNGRETDANRLADQHILREGLGLTNTECQMLRTAAEQLRERRYARGTSA